MDLLGIVQGILNVAKALLGLNKELFRARTERRTEMAKLFDEISDCLADVSAEIRVGNIPHGKCTQIITFANELPPVIEEEVGTQKAEELGRDLHSAYQVEKLADSMKQVADREPYLQQIEEAAGKFRALAHILRHT